MNWDAILVCRTLLIQWRLSNKSATQLNQVIRLFDFNLCFNEQICVSAKMLKWNDKRRSW